LESFTALIVRSQEVKCLAGFDIKKKINDISRLKNVPLDLIQI
jgi:hypothetical protein